jgi:hypothetical protein
MEDVGSLLSFFSMTAGGWGWGGEHFRSAPLHFISHLGTFCYVHFFYFILKHKIFRDFLFSMIMSTKTLGSEGRETTFFKSSHGRIRWVMRGGIRVHLYQFLVDLT